MSPYRNVEGPFHARGEYEEVLPGRVVVRGYLSVRLSGRISKDRGGSVASDYPGIEGIFKVEEPFLLPATKAEMGLHDENITLRRWRKRSARISAADEIQFHWPSIRKQRFAEQRGIRSPIRKWSLGSELENLF